MTPEENEMLTRVGPGTPGRRDAAALLVAGVVRVRRSATSRSRSATWARISSCSATARARSACSIVVCAHRRASLTLGRVEERGIRCCYHGWLYGADGQCLEMPAEPPGSKLHEEVKLRRGQDPGRRRFGLRLPRPRSGAAPAALRPASSSTIATAPSGRPTIIAIGCSAPRTAWTPITPWRCTPRCTPRSRSSGRKSNTPRPGTGSAPIAVSRRRAQRRA